MTRPTTSVERLAEEYRALRDAAAVVDLTDWTVLALTGPDSREFLQGTATQEFESLPPPATATRTLFLTEKGRPVAHAWILAGPEPTSAILISDPGARSSLKAHLERFRVMEDVEIQGPDGMARPFGLAGPERDPLARAIAAKIEGARAVRSEPLSFVLVPPQTSPSLLPPTVDPHAFEAWRIRAGIPYQGIDMDQDRIATELFLPEAISMTKGCYVGQEVVARTANRGKLRRQRIGFRFAWAGEPIPRGAEIRFGAQEAGIVTSTTREPGTREGLGMGYAMPEALASGMDLLAMQGEKSTHLSPGSWPL